MRNRLYNQIARKYGMATFIPCREVDGTTPQSESFLDYGVSTTQADFGGTFAPSFNTVGNGDWIDTSAATTSSLITSTKSILPGTLKGFILAFAFKSDSHSGLMNTGEFSVGNPASAGSIQYASDGVASGTVTIKDLLASTTTITCTEQAGSGIKGCLIHLGERATSQVTVWSGRVTGITASTGSDVLTTPGGNILTSNYYIQDTDELHPILAWEYNAGSIPTPTDAEVADFFAGIYATSRFGRQTSDWDAIPETWTNTAVRDAYS